VWQIDYRYSVYFVWQIDCRYSVYFVWQIDYRYSFLRGELTKPTLYIFTGPPGSGKSTLAGEVGAPVYDVDLGNKMEWIPSKFDGVLCTSAPSKENKEFWVKTAKQNGFNPILYVVWIDRWTSYKRMKARSGMSPDQRNNLEKGVERWYSHYSPHPKESRLYNE